MQGEPNPVISLPLWMSKGGVGPGICEVNMNYSLPRTHGRSFSRLVEQAGRHWEARRQAAAAEQDISSRVSLAFTVALSREAGTQGTSVAQEVGKLLSWPVYDHELLEQIAQDMGLRTSLLESVDERQQSWLLETAKSFLTAPARGDWRSLVTESAFVHYLIKTVLALGIHGNCVIVGRGASFILPAATTVRVRLVGPVRERIAALSRTLGISEAEAAVRVRTMDRERTDFVQDHFFKDPADPSNYDIFLNASRLSVIQCAELIAETLKCLQRHGGYARTV
jgi:cytidylate kinase